MTEAQPAAGADLARAALAAARAAAKTAPNPRKKTPRPTKRTHRGGRDPLGLASVIDQLMDERGLIPPETGGSILDQWPTIAPELADKVIATRFAHDTGVLYLQPLSPAYATQLRMFQRQTLARIREKTGQNVVRALRILPPGPPSREHTEATAPQPPAVPVAPVRTRETAHPGYRQALAAHLEHRPAHGPTDPYLLQALARQEAALRAHRLPEDGLVHELETADEAAARHARSEAARKAALAYKHGEQKNGSAVLPRALDIA